MSFVPKVHIVGDESDEVEVNQEIQTNTNIAADSNDNRRPVEESETSESTEDDETDENEKESDSSSDEGADWSMDVTHIARTPERYSSTVPQQYETIDNKTPMNIDMDCIPCPPENGNQNADRKQQEKSSLVTDLQGLPSNFKDTPIEEVDGNQKGSMVIPAKNVAIGNKPVCRKYESPKGVLASDLQISSDSDVTIDEKDEMETKKFTLPVLSLPLPTANSSQFKSLALSRLRLPSSMADYSTPTTIGGRVAKRARRSTVSTQPTQNVDTEHLFAKPLDVTMYFQELSAKLVKSRVKLMPFLGLRLRINSLVDQAMAQN